MVDGHVTLRNVQEKIKGLILFCLISKKLPMEEIVDEMLAILSDRNRIMAKKDMEATNAKWNEMMANGFPVTEE